MGETAPSSTPGSGRERVFTPALVVFLLAVAVLDLGALWWRHRLPSLDGAIFELADGDMDTPERTRYLRYLCDRGPASASTREQWAAMLAAVALADEAGLDQALRALGGPPVPKRSPAAAEREFLGLGDPLLENLSAALQAEVDGDRAQATRRWGQVQNEGRLTGQPLPTRLAAEALQRLH